MEKNKHLLLFILTLAISFTANAYDFMVDDMCYNFNEDGTSVTVTYQRYPPDNHEYGAYANLSGSLTIPPSVTYGGNTYDVTAIGDRAFGFCTSLTSVTIPNSVTTIGNLTFWDCTRLTSVTIPNSVTTIGYYAFYGCRGLTSLTIPNSVTTIDRDAFNGCRGLKSLTIGNSVTSIGSGAFEGCSGLASVTIPNSVTAIGEGAFWGCSGLTSLVVQSGNTNYDSRNDCNAIIETTSNTLIFGCKNTIIPNSVTTIGSGAFSGCSGLTSVTIPNSVTTIGRAAFYDCSGLTSVTIPNSVTTIGGSAFYNCSGLTSVTIPNSVTSIGDQAFSSCSGLTSVTIGNSVTTIGSYAFYKCSNLSSIIIGNSVTEFGYYDVFSGCPIDTLTLTGKGASNIEKATYYSKTGNTLAEARIINIGNEITSIGIKFINPNVVNCYANIPPACAAATFSSYDGELHVPSASAVAYFTADYWQNFNNMFNDLTDKLTLNKTDASLIQWETITLSTTTIPENSEILWSTTDPSVATVDENGIVTATGDGECDIFATNASNYAVYASCHISVSYPEISLSLSEESLGMNVGDEQTLTATIIPDNTGLTPTWASSNTSVALVDTNGKVTAVSEGECDITATVLDKTATCHVRVSGDVTITLNIENAIIGAGQIMTVFPACAPDVPVDLVVTSSDPSVALVRVVNRTNAPAPGLQQFTERVMAPALASEKAIMIVGVQNGTATITVTTADGKATPAVLELRVVDLNGDGIVDVSDVNIMIDMVLGKQATDLTTADLNGDNTVDVSDVNKLIDIVLGKE